MSTNRPSDPKFGQGIQEGTAAPDLPVIPEASGVEFAASAKVDEETIEPSYEEAKKRSDWPEWLKAAQIEYETLLAAGTWYEKLVERPEDQNVVDCKWALRLKKKADGTVDKWKARLVAKGFTQVEGVDFFETYAPVAKLGSIRSILAIAARNDWEIDQFDFHGAFLNGVLDHDEVIYMEQPPDFEIADRTRYVLRLRKTIYGLRQSSRKWYEALATTLAQVGFFPLEKDHAVFVNRSHPHITILAIHVDDTTITGSSPRLVKYFQHEIGKQYKITLLGPIHWLLGIEIIRDRAKRTISLAQHSQVQSVLHRFKMDDCKPLSMPMDPHIQLSSAQSPADGSVEQQEMRQMPYREGVGSLMWLSIATRPDISFVVGILSRYLHNPGYAHWQAFKRCLRYLQGTKDYRLTFGENGRQGLEGFSDADGMSLEDRRAISGYVFLIDGGAVSWSSRKQEIVSLSTTEAEYIALTYAAKEALWLRQFLSELFPSSPLQPLTLHDDNQGAVALAHAHIGQFHARTKHIDIRYHFIRYAIEDNLIRVVYCPTENMVADMFTKPLPAAKLTAFNSNVGLLSD
jgi:hypothetical protein